VPQRGDHQPSDTVRHGVSETSGDPRGEPHDELEHDELPSTFDRPSAGPSWVASRHAGQRNRWWTPSVVSGIVESVHNGRSRRSVGSGALEPHVPVDRLDDGTWVYACVGDVLVVAGGTRIVCHACGDALEAITRHHVRRHDLDLSGYRTRFGLNRKTSLIAPRRAETRRVEGRRRWASNEGVRDGLEVGQAMAKSGELHAIGVAVQPTGSRRRQGRRAASRAEASPSLTSHRAEQADEARGRWEQRARVLGFDNLEGYLADRRRSGTTPWHVRSELRCGSAMAARLPEEGR
jgi:hypothetical protein